MQRIYIDVTKFLEVDFITGIQRVVKSVVLEMAKVIPEQLFFLAYTDYNRSFTLLDRDAFLAYLNGEKEKKLDLLSAKTLLPSDMGAGNIFFDLDSVWNLSYKRSVLLPELKKTGLRLAVYVYDIIPITEPHFGHPNTVFNFMAYIGAYLQYADLIIASAQSTLDEIYKLADKLSLPHVPGHVSWLGCDFSKDIQSSNIPLPLNVRKAVSKKYILCVGTIEPRKNHAYILDACEKELFAKGFNLVFAGRLGWNMDQFQERVLACPYYNRQFFWLQGMDDRVIDYLYRNAFVVAFPTFNEGFGLPIVEAFQRGTPVVTTDKPVLREVGKDFCEYIDPRDPKTFIDVISSYDQDPEKYSVWKEKIKSFVPFTWKETSDKIIAALDTLKTKQWAVKHSVRQMYLLTARPDSVAKTLPFIDAFMPFLDEVVIGCPDKMKEEMQNAYHGRLHMKILTDGQLLNGRPLPKDHQARNFFLRCLAMRSGELDDVFIMSDDDYRPLEKIDLQQFVMGNRYRAYYFYDMNQWRVTVGNITSYDVGQERTLDFLKENSYPRLQYSSHMPQIIDRDLYLEMLDAHPGLEEMGIDEWTGYFNYMHYHYPEAISSEPYITMSWPAHGSDWTLYIMPQTFLFENYYEELYKKGGMFEGFSEEYYPGIEAENREKIKIARQRLETYQRWRDQFTDFQKSYEMEYGCSPSFCLIERNKEKILLVPRRLELPLHGVIRIPFYCGLSEESFQVEVSMTDAVGNLVLQQTSKEVRPYKNQFKLPVFGGVGKTIAGTYNLTIEFKITGENVKASLPVTCL